MRVGNTEEFCDAALRQVAGFEPPNQPPLPLRYLPHGTEYNSGETKTQGVKKKNLAYRQVLSWQSFTGMGSRHVLMRADLVLRENIRALLDRSGETADALSSWCHHKSPWMSKILSGERNVVILDLGKIADFFGVEVAHLFLPGASSLTERRSGDDRRGTQDRRNGFDRRKSWRPGRSDPRAVVDPTPSPFANPHAKRGARGLVGQTPTNSNIESTDEE